MAFGMANDIGLQALDLILHAVHEVDVCLYVLAHAGIVKPLCQVVAIGTSFQLLGDAGQVVLEVGQLDVRLQLGAPVDEVVAPAQQIPGGAHLLRVDMG